MSDNKEYISQMQENGSIHISEDVISGIAGVAILEVDGVCGLSANLGSDIAEMLGKKNLGKGIRITIGSENDITIDCFVVAKLGNSVIDIAKNVQEAVASAVESVTGLSVTAVNVTISGIALPKESRK